MTIRHIKRLKAKVREFGAKGLIHVNRGKQSNRKIDDKTVEQAKSGIA